MSGLTIALPDGSVATVESTGHNSSVVSRAVDGETVWGQVFACGPREDHEVQVRSVLDDMAERPDDFRRWWSADGRARDRGHGAELTVFVLLLFALLAVGLVAVVEAVATDPVAEVLSR